MNMSVVDTSMLATEHIRPLRRHEYEQLARDGAFDDERVELLFGVIVEMSPPDPSHDESIYWVGEHLRKQLGELAVVRIQSTFAASDISEPQPDVLVVPPGSYWTAHPERAYLAVEVSKSSLRKDRVVKAKLYGGADVEEYWIVDVVAGEVEVCRDPLDGEWRSRTTYRRGQRIAMARFPEVVVAVDEVVPPVAS